MFKSNYLNLVPVSTGCDDFRSVNVPYRVRVIVEWFCAVCINVVFVERLDFDFAGDFSVRVANDGPVFKIAIFGEILFGEGEFFGRHSIEIIFTPFLCDGIAVQGNGIGMDFFDFAQGIAYIVLAANGFKDVEVRVVHNSVVQGTPLFPHSYVNSVSTH